MIGVSVIQILKLNVGDEIELKKQHPCGCKLFKILRVGSDIRIKCNGCGHDMTLDREKCERAIKRIVTINSIEMKGN